jgi:putative transposase
MKKHSRQEILLKLRQGEELARAGKSQVEICKALGVSVMTFHRWRKLPLTKIKAEPAHVRPELASTRAPRSAAETDQLLEELTIENQRLRKIVTDLLLEKSKLEESAAFQPRIVSPQKNLAKV